MSIGHVSGLGGVGVGGVTTGGVGVGGVTTGGVGGVTTGGVGVGGVTTGGVGVGGFSFCAPKIYPTRCVRKCRADKGALGGKCTWEHGINVKCLCDFCRHESGQILSGI